MMTRIRFRAIFQFATFPGCNRTAFASACSPAAGNRVFRLRPEVSGLQQFYRQLSKNIKEKIISTLILSE